jgi:hypothetical protein
MRLVPGRIIINHFRPLRSVEMENTLPTRMTTILPSIVLNPRLFFCMFSLAEKLRLTFSRSFSHLLLKRFITDITNSQRYYMITIEEHYGYLRRFDAVGLTSLVLPLDFILLWVDTSQTIV